MTGVALGFWVLFSCVFLDSAKNVSGVISHLGTLSSPPPPLINYFYGLIPVVAIVVILIALQFRRSVKKHWKKITAAALIIATVIAVFYATLSAEASINYWFISPGNTATQDNYLTMYCENTGHLAGTFDLELAFTNAHFSLKTSLPYQLIDDRTVKFTFTLQPGERQSKQSWFIIDNNVTDFYIYLSFSQNDGNFFVRGNSGGVDSVSYQKDANDSNFTMRVFMPPP
jgi:hypothetical protein